MFGVCPRCGEYSDEKRIEPDGPFAICPACGHRQKFLRLPLFIVTGASGTGKSTVALHLAAPNLDYVCFDTDVLWRSEYSTPEDGYTAFRNLGLRVASAISQSGRPVVLMAGGIPEQFEASPQRRYFANLHYLALVCDDAVLVGRLRARPGSRWSGGTHLIEQERSFNQWLIENALHTVPPMTTVDTSAGTADQAARAVARWIDSALSG